MKPEQRAAIEKRTAELIGAIRRALIEPAESAIATIERIGAQTYPPEVAAHVIEQLSQLVREINWKLNTDASMIRRLGNGLFHFEKRLFAMCRGRQ